MSMRLLAVVAAVALMAVSCGLLNPQQSQALDPLIRAADGKLYAPACVAALGTARLGECAVETGASNTRNASDTSSWLMPYYDYFQSNGYYSYVDPYFYAPQTFCGRWGWSTNCFGWFGYGDWWTPPGNGGYCDGCFDYTQNNPLASQTQTSNTQGANFCPSYCSSWWYPTPGPQPTVDACKGLSGSYSGSCWSSNSYATTSVALTVAASNGVCQVSSTGYSTARVTVQGGSGVAALIGTTAGSAAFLDLYGSSSFSLSGYDATSYNWFRCSSVNAYQPWY